MSRTLKLIISIVGCEAVGLIGSFFTAPAIQSGWYVYLAKPQIAPPNWVFGPVWTILYALMGVAVFLVWSSYTQSTQDRKRKIKISLFIFLIQLVLNACWSVIFFGSRNPEGAFIEIIFLWLAILASIIAFAKISKPAAWLLVPYILWVSFAGYLNYAIVQLNHNNQEAIFCTQEAKQCPDGSYVGRSGSNCEFDACPSVAIDPSWQTETSSTTRAIFRYPTQLSTTYIHVVDWPPQIQVLTEPFICTQAGSEIMRAGRTEQRTVENRTYCRTVESGAAAGSIYDNYTYAFQRGEKVVILTFTTRMVQCDNYDDPQKTECKNERNVFDIDSVADKMAQSVVLK